MPHNVLDVMGVNTSMLQICFIVCHQVLSRVDLRSVWQFLGHLIWAPKFSKGRKRKTTLLHKNKELSSATILSKPNIESEQIHAVSRTKSQVSTKS